MQNLPLGLQDFEGLRLRNDLYVDKTMYVLDLIQQPKYMFFARPRRMGKSLLCSTLKYVYQGRQDLFEGLYIYDKIDWEAIQHPVIHIDFSRVNTKYLEDSLKLHMEMLASDFQISFKQSYRADSIFQILLATLSENNQKVVVIIDEYDKALNDFLDNLEQFEENKQILRNFYGILKPYDNKLEKVFLTGVSKFGKVSVFSQLNNITDYSYHAPFANMCGYTQEELERYFQAYMERTTQYLETTQELLLAEIKRFYNGYSFNGENTLYNPYSVLNFFHLQEFRNYWYDTGTPTFLMKVLKDTKFSPLKLEHIDGTSQILDTTETNIYNPVALLFQTGYLTIKQARRKKLRLYYKLGFPNAEVKEAFSNYLLAYYLPSALDKTQLEYSSPMRDALENQDFEAIQQIAQATYASVVYELHEKKYIDTTKDEHQKAIEAEGELLRKEMFYHALFHILMNATGFRTESEILTNLGRIDMAVETSETLYLFEFKVDATAEIALDQIMHKGYMEKYQTSPLAIFAVGINFDSVKRNVQALTYQLLKASSSRGAC